MQGLPEDGTAKNWGTTFACINSDKQNALPQHLFLFLFFSFFFEHNRTPSEAMVM